MSEDRSSYEAVLFDFDYTLADSSEGIIQCVNGALQILGLPQAGHDAIRATIGLSLVDIYAQLAGPTHPEWAPQFHRLFMQRADEIMVGLTRIYPSVAGTVRALQGCRLRLGILSTKYRYRIESVLTREGLRAAFELIIGGEDVHQHKPDPEGLLLALERLGCEPTALLYVGDSTTDAEAAQRAAIPFVAVLSGVTPVATFDRYPTLAILDDVSALPRWLGCNDLRGSGMQAQGAPPWGK